MNKRVQHHGLWVSGAALVALGAYSAAGCGATKTGSEAETSAGPVQAVSEAVTTTYDWMQFGGDSRHGGNNTLETKITSANVNKLAQLFRISLPETIEGAPVVLTNVTTPSGVHDVGFVTTRNGALVAFDAYTGNTLWTQQPPGGQITMSSPAVDPSRAYVYGVGLDQHLHKYAVGDGTEVLSGGWPELFTNKPTVEKGSTALTIATIGGTTYLYLGTGGYDGDGGDYQGHVTTVNLNTGTETVFNAMCSDQTVHFGTSPDCAAAKSGIWAKAGVTFDPATNRLYAVTGNGTYAPASRYWGDSIMALSPDGTGAGGNPLDTYTPSVYQTLQNNDKDLGSTNLLILPNNGSKYPHLGAMSGKDALIRLVNLDNLSGQGGPGHVAGEIASAALTTGGENQNPSSSWINPADGSTWLFFVSPANGINAYHLLVDGSGNPSLSPIWSAGGGGGGAAIANNVLYYATNNVLHALNPTTGAELWRDTTIGAIHWQTPAIVNGVVYIGDNARELTAYSINTEVALSRAGWTAVGTPTGGDVAANALDGNTATRWSTGTAMTNGMSFVVDMKSTQTFDEISMLAGGATDYPRSFQVFVSNDGVNFGSAVTSGTGGGTTVTVAFPAQSARFVKVVQTGAASNWWSIAEFNVLSSGASGGGGGTGGATGSGGTSASGGGGATGGGGTTSGGASGTGGSAGSSGTFASAIDCGGPALASYVADVDFTGGSTINHANTIDLSGVTNPAPAAAYQSGRIGNFSYTIPGFAPNSSHTVRLHFAETYFATAGSRVFNVSINGTSELSSFDIESAAGAQNKAITRSFTLNANASGAYVIQTQSIKDNSLISAIDIQ